MGFLREGIDDFDQGIARVYFGNTPSLNEAEAAADWGYGLTTLFIQDEIQASDNVEVVVGLKIRYLHSRWSTS